jgi:hypothetical protein
MKMKSRGRCLGLDVMIAIFLLILINFLMALARQQSRKWAKQILMLVSFLLLLLALGFGIRALS